MAETVATPDTEEETAQALNKRLHEGGLGIPDGFFFGRDPRILAMRVMAADQIADMPTPKEVAAGVPSHTLPNGSDFIDSSSIRNENKEILMSEQVVVALFSKNVLPYDAKSLNGLDRFNIMVAFYIDCHSNSAQNGQPCCTRIPKFQNIPNDYHEEFSQRRRSALENVGRLLKNEFWQ